MTCYIPAMMKLTEKQKIYQMDGLVSFLRRFYQRPNNMFSFEGLGWDLG